uniref:G-protein coupled receptors family 1 profile domain-containing protein n=1 Tax=Panagrolaimus davidi TaxID=227884 RepID=A0A914PQ66_9BILA
MAEPLPYMIYLVLVQNILMFIMHLITFILLSHSLYTKIKMLKESEISPPFLLFGGSVSTNDPAIIYVTTAAVLMVLPIVSLAVFFLILHRTLIITRFMARSNIHQWLLGFSIFSMFCLMVFTAAYYVWTWTMIYPAPADNCWSVNCVTRFNGSIFSVWAKLVTGFMNSIVGSWFFYELKKSQSQISLSQQPKEQGNRKKANKLAFITIILEIILNFIPAFVDLVLRSTINLSLTQYVGVYTMFFGATDGIFVAILYSKSFGKIKSIKAGAISTFKTTITNVSVSQIKVSIHK